MISVSTVKTYMFCPLKLYFQSQIDGEVEDEDNYFIPKSLKDLRIDLQDILHKNLRQVKKDMKLSEIERRLAQGYFNQINTTFEIIEEVTSQRNEKSLKSLEDKNGALKSKDSNPNSNLNNENDYKNNSNNTEYQKDERYLDENHKNLERDHLQVGNIEFLDEKKIKEQALLEQNQMEKEELKSLKEELISEANLNLKILSLKVEQAMKNLDKDGDEIQNIFFPSSMYNYLIRDLGMDLIGVIDKIEVEKGKYFPILFKTSKPPQRGVWDGEIMEVAANVLLVEQEFDTHITVGFIDYLKINQRRPVVIDTSIRKSFFKMLTNINKILEKGEIPTVKANLNKCNNCEYKRLCEKA